MWCVSCTVVVLTCFVMCRCVCVGFVMCGCFDNCVGVMCVLVFTVFFIVCIMFVYCFIYVYLFSMICLY